MYRKPPRPPAKPLPRPTAVEAMMESEFKEREWGIAGEWETPSTDPAPPPPPPFQIPPPPWSVNYDPALDPDHEPAIEPPSEEDER
jgi:hypothetical protein